MLKSIDIEDVKYKFICYDNLKRINNGNDKTNILKNGNDILRYLLFDTDYLNKYNIRIVDFIIDLPLNEINYYNYKDSYRKKGKFGVYILSNEYNIIYIGSSSNIEHRIAYHEKRKLSSIVSIFMINNYQDAFNLENILINDLQPEQNKIVYVGN